MPDLDASYSGITSMMEEIGPEETLHYLQQEWAVQISRKQIAEQQLKEAETAEHIARTGLSNFAKAIVQRKIGAPQMIQDINLGSMVKLTSINENHVITICVNTETTRAYMESSTAFILTKKDDENENT